MGDCWRCLRPNLHVSEEAQAGIFGNLIKLVRAVLVQFEKCNAGGERLEDVPRPQDGPAQHRSKRDREGPIIYRRCVFVTGD